MLHAVHVHLVECQLKKRRRGRSVGEKDDRNKLLQSRKASRMKLEPFDHRMNCQIADADNFSPISGVCLTDRTIILTISSEMQLHACSNED